MLYDAAQAVNAVLEAALHRIESVAHRDKHILMCVVLGGVARHRNLAFRQHEVNADVVELSLAVAVSGSSAQARLALPASAAARSRMTCLKCSHSEAAQISVCACP
jgi:hypothetical protein